MISLLSKLKLSHLFVLLAISLGSYSFYAYSKILELKYENNRVTDNYKNALKIDSLEVAIFKINNTSELEELLDQNKGLKKLVDQSEVKTKRIEGLYYQQLKYLDNIEKKIDVSSLVDKIKNNIPTSKNWIDSTACAVIKGNVTFKEDSLNVNITSKEFNNNVVLIKKEGRKEPIKWLFGLRLGKRKTEFTPEVTCGEVKVTIIEKDK